MRSSISLFLFLVSALIGCAWAETPATPFRSWRDVPATPLREFTAPAPERFELENGLVVLLLEDHELPLIDLNLLVRAGSIHEPAECAGLADAVAAIMRSGGSAHFPGDKLDALLDDMAAHMSLGMGSDSGYGSLSALKEDFPKALEMFVDVLRNPAFPEEKIELYLSQARTAVAKRNDNPSAIAWREVRKALYGEKSPFARSPEYSTLNKIDRQALQAFHDAYYHPNMFILGISGDFKKDEMLALLRQTFGDWPKAQVKLPDVPEPSASRKQRVLFCERPQTNQTMVLLGHMLELRRDSKDYPALYMLREALSGNMSSRLFSEIRSKKGLAYTVGAQFNVNFDRPGTFLCHVLTRNEQAVAAAEALQQELQKVREEGVTREELAKARESLENGYVFDFDSPEKIVRYHTTFEFYNYPADFTERLFKSMQAVTLEDCNRAARKYLEPEKCLLLAVGNSAGLPPEKTFASLKNFQLLDVSIPAPVAAPMVIDPERELRGKRILADCLKAAGGVENFKQIDALRADLVLTVKALGREFHLKAGMTAQFPEKIRMDVAGPFGPISQIIRQGQAWRATGSSVQELKPENARKNLRSLLQSDLGILCMLAKAHEGYNVQALEPIREDNRTLLGVELESQSLGRLKLWTDADSHLIVKMRYVGDGVQKVYDKYFNEPAQFGKLTLARQIVDKDPAGPAETELVSLKLNPEIKPGLFEKLDRATPPEE